MDEGDCALVQLLLVKVLVLDGVEVDKVAHVGAQVPADVLGVHVDLPQELEHFTLVCVVGLGSGRCSCLVLAVVVVVIVVVVVVVVVCRGRIRGVWERERVCDLELSVDVHSDNGASCNGRESLGAVLDDAHDDLF